jgi:hypothetical protein
LWGSKFQVALLLLSSSISSHGSLFFFINANDATTTQFNSLLEAFLFRINKLINEVVVVVVAVVADAFDIEK